MQKDVAAWRASGLTKKEFLKDKPYSKSKFEYWISKLKDIERPSVFQEVDFSDSRQAKANKVLEIEHPTGVKINVFS
jgi:hypothetical protein